MDQSYGPAVTTRRVKIRFFCESVAYVAPMKTDGKRHVASAATAQKVNLLPLFSSVDSEMGNSAPGPLEIHIYDRKFWGSFMPGQIYACSFSAESLTPAKQAGQRVDGQRNLRPVK